MTAFAKKYNIPKTTLQRELKRGCAEGIFHMYDKAKKEHWYHKYSATLAQENATLQGSQKGPRGKLTNVIAELIMGELRKKISVYTVLHNLRLQGIQNLPCARTVYYHLKDGSLTSNDGEIFYTSRKTKPKQAQPKHSKACPEHRKIEDRPQSAADRKEFGHWEMDTVVSGRDGKGGLLVLIERSTRYFIIQKLSAITQDAVLNSLRQIMRENQLKMVRSVTTDNGSEFLDQKELDKVFKSEIYYTHAYSSWEKGSVENCNRLIRRWYPKSYDFSRTTKRQIKLLEETINSIVRPISLKGKTAHEAFQSAA